jgi:epoxyqueuosine reductase
VVPTELRDELAEIGRTHGLEKVGFCSAAVFADTRAVLHERRDEGLHATMQFTYRNPDRSTDPGRALPGARSLVVGALSYRRVSPRADEPGPHGRVGEYVWEPYYDRLRAALGAIAARLIADGHGARVLVDDNALVDRAAAHRAGIGWWGKNSNLLIPGKGSRFALGSVVTDVDLGSDGEPIADGCGSCRRCIDSCPTGAIVADGVIDSNRCLAWLVQATGPFPPEYRRALGDRIYGCDDCQSSCPPNVAFDRTEPPATTTGAATVRLLEMLELDDDELIDRFGAWYIPRREARYLRRNALVALGNTAAPDDGDVRSALERLLASADPIERGHAVWAAAELGHRDLIEPLVADPDRFVREEVRLAGIPGGDR